VTWSKTHKEIFPTFVPIPSAPRRPEGMIDSLRRAAEPPKRRSTRHKGILSRVGLPAARLLPGVRLLPGSRGLPPPCQQDAPNLYVGEDDGDDGGLDNVEPSLLPTTMQKDHGPWGPLHTCAHTHTPACLYRPSMRACMRACMRTLACKYPVDHHSCTYPNGVTRHTPPPPPLPRFMMVFNFTYFVLPPQTYIAAPPGMEFDLFEGVCGSQR
jgi:hypothetical protein